MSNKHIKETKIIKTRKTLGELTTEFEFVMDKDDPAHKMLNTITHNNYRKTYHGFAYRMCGNKIVEAYGIPKAEFTPDTEVEKL